jgi:hypothetical protein
MDVDYVRRYVTAGAGRLLVRRPVTADGGFGRFREDLLRFRSAVLDRL